MSSRPQNVYVYAPGTRIPVFSKEFNRAVTALSIGLNRDRITIKDHNAILRAGHETCHRDRHLTLGNLDYAGLRWQEEEGEDS